MKFISVLALVASVSAVAIPDGGWNSWQNQCPPAATSYVTKYETKTQPAVTSYVTEYKTQPAVTSYVTKYETKYETATVTAYQTKYETKYSTITAPCAQQSWGQWNNWGKSA